MQFELVVPCYNEEKSLEAICTRCIEAARKNGFDASSFNFILVENGSRDNSRAVLKSLVEREEFRGWLKPVFIDQNQGYGFGIWTGLQASRAEIVGWSHADQQCDPMDAFKALKLLRDAKNPKKTVVKGVRRGRSFKEILVSRVFESIASVSLGNRFYEINAQPKVFYRELLALCPNPPKDFAFDLYILFRALKNGYSLQTFEVAFPARIHGFSNWANSLKNRWRHIRNMIQYIRELSKVEGRIK